MESCPSAWDGYVGQVTAKAASKARDTQTVVEIHYDEMPDFYKSNPQFSFSSLACRGALDTAVPDKKSFRKDE